MKSQSEKSKSHTLLGWRKKKVVSTEWENVVRGRRRRKFHGRLKFIFGAIFLLLVPAAVIIGYTLIMQAIQPLYVSPLPFIQDLMVDAATDDDTVRNTIAAELTKQHLQYKRIDTSEENSYSIQLSDGQLVLVTKNKDISVQIASLQVIHNRLTMEGKRFKKLDLRFSKPVITFY